MSRAIVLATIIALALVAAVPGALMAKNAGSTTQYTETIDFVWDAADCSVLPEGLTIHYVGTLRGHFHLSTDANGVVHLNWGPDSAQGTATDNLGGRYRFNYHNMLVERESDAQVDILITDHLNLVGRGVAHGLRVVFILKAQIVDGAFNVLFFKIQGDPLECDAI
jgi:hypothetical protein